MTKRINFEKRKMESLKYSGTKKLEIYYAKNYESLCLVVSKNKKSYFAHWSVPVSQKDGKIKRVGKRKFLGGYHMANEKKVKLLD